MKRWIAFAGITAVLNLMIGCVSYTPNQVSLLYGYYMIKGTSMKPTLEEPNVVLVKPLPFGSIESGDIIVFKVRDQLVAHRAVKKLNGVWITQGDGLKDRDPTRVSMSNYKGTIYTDAEYVPGVHTNILGRLHAADTKR